MANERILVVEDEKLIRMSLVDELTRQGYQVYEADTGGAGIAKIDEEPVDLLLLDYRLPDIDGLQVLREVSSKHPETLVILMTAYSSIENAVQAIKLGAYDYINKPFDMDEMIIRIKKALETTELRREVRMYTAKQKEQFGLARLIGRSEAMQRVREQIRRIAHSGASTVLIRGESGVGKDVIAKAIHYESERARYPFVNVTCTAIPENLLESELFGHEKGAFTDARMQKKGLFELARNGTVFLDEIGDMPAVLQAKLLRFLEERNFRRVGGTEDISVDVRIIAATNRDLDEAVRKGEFRADLYYRLKVIPMEVPPLRDRVDDIPLLAQTFVDQLRAEFRSKSKGLSAAALKLLTRYPWPGNIRELRNAIERAMILGSAELVEPQDLPAELEPGRSKPGEAEGLVNLPPEGVRLEAVEESLVGQALNRTRGNQSAAARLLGITRDQLRYRMERMGLLAPPPKRRAAAEREGATGPSNGGNALEV
jgi:two-component system, NtrC family, response regulator AtoC